MVKVIYAPRPDGTFVIEHPGGGYHVTHDDPLYPEAAAAAAGRDDLPPEPEPRVFSAETMPPPTLSQLQAQLAALQAQIEALS
ncbi:MAG TPA: hypothetical protein VGN96_03945 [Roseococcus sp.]|jgi:hypothetical protein|nr:hypothetical protein [Roseococcus sp.]